MTPRQIILHHTASGRDFTTLKDVDNWHKARWPNFKSSLGFYVSYHHLILNTGEIIQTRRDFELGAHAIPNEGRIGIALVGNFEIEQPSEKQLSALRELLRKLKNAYRLTNKDIFGHCEVSRTLCPGKNLFEWFKNYKTEDLNEIQKIISEIQKKIGELEKLAELLVKVEKNKNK